MTYRPVRPAQELKIHAAILRTVSERGLGRRPIAEVTTADVAAMAHAAWRTLPEARPVERLANGKLPPDLLERAVALAPDRAAAETVPACPPAARKAPPADTEVSQALNARERAFQRLRENPTACAVLALVGEGHPNQRIADQLQLNKSQVKDLTRRWIHATESLGRADLATWARRHAATVGPEAGR